VPDKLRTQIHLFKCKVQGDDGGEQVSQYVMTNLGKRLHKHPDFETNIQKALKDVFLGIDRLFKRDSSIDVSSILATKDVILYLLKSPTDPVSLNCKSMDQKENAKGTMTHDDEFIVIASDGVWEYMDSNEVGDLVGEALDEGLGISEACKKLISNAMERLRLLLKRRYNCNCC